MRGARARARKETHTTVPSNSPCPAKNLRTTVEPSTTGLSLGVCEMASRVKNSSIAFCCAQSGLCFGGDGAGAGDGAVVAVSCARIARAFESAAAIAAGETEAAGAGARTGIGSVGLPG